MSLPLLYTISLKYSKEVTCWRNRLLHCPYKSKVSSLFSSKKTLISFWNTTSKIVPKAKSKSSKVYFLSLAEQSELDIFLSENLCTSQIYPSKLSMTTPVFFTKKKDSSLCLVQNYRSLNAVTVKNKYLLLLISELVIQL